MAQKTIIANGINTFNDRDADINSNFTELYGLDTALVKYYGDDGRWRFDDTSKFLYFEIQTSPGVWIEKFRIENSIAIDRIRLVEGVKETIPVGSLGLYNKRVDVAGIGDTEVMTLVDPNDKEYVFVVADLSNDKIFYIHHDGTITEVPKLEDLDLLFKDAVRENENLVLTRVNDAKVYISLGTVYHTPSIKDFAMNIPTRIDVGTDINELTNVYYNVANHQNITGLSLNISEGNISEIALPQQDGHISTLALIDSVDTSTPKNIEFQITGTSAEPGTFQSNKYIVQVADPVAIKDIYHGASSENPGDVNLALLTKVPYVTPGQTESWTDQATAGQYHYIFVPHDPDLNKIYNTTFGDTDVTSTFEKTLSAQTIGGIVYDAYRLGPASATGTIDLKVVMN